MPIKNKNKKIIIGNWKMNPSTHEAAQHIVKDIKKAAARLVQTIVVLCPPTVFIKDCTSKKAELPFLVGAQDVSYFDSGSHTGEVGADMLRDSGVTHVIIGHSERRKMGETDEMVSKKVCMVHETGLISVVCVGEESRDQTGDYLEVLKNQIKNSLHGVEKKHLSKLIIAYEPVWAIGATQAMSAGDIYETTLFIKKTLSDLFGQEYVSKVPVLYGGSVNFRNAGEIVALGHVDGLLVGRESVNPPGFNEILRTVDEL